MSTNALQAVQTELNERGVRDVKFFFNSEHSVSEAKEKVAYFLKTYLRGDCELAPPAGDTKII
jgi:hypothetical protein